MLTPSNRTITIASGGTALVGRTTAIPAPGGGGGGSGTPAWMATAGVALNKIVAVPNSAIAGTAAAGAGTGAYSGHVAKTDTSELIAACNGGHPLSDNGVYGFILGADAPAWYVRNPPTVAGQISTDSQLVATGRNQDGKPGARHSYDANYFIESRQQIIMAGGRFGGINAVDMLFYDAFDLNTNAWLASGTYSFAGYGLVADTEHQTIWNSGGNVFDPVTNTYSATIANYNVQTRFPAAYDTTLHQVFCLQFGDGQEGGSTVNASRILVNATTKAQEPVTFNASAAYSQFISEGGALNGAYAAMCYDPVNTCFYWHAGKSARTIFKITPNSGTAWDMSIFTPAAGSATLDAAASAGVVGKMKYFPLLKGFTVCPTGTGTIFFIKTS